MPVPKGARHLWVEGLTEAVCGARGAALLVTRRLERVTCKRCKATKIFISQDLLLATWRATHERN